MFLLHIPIKPSDPISFNISVVFIFPTNQIPSAGINSHPLQEIVNNNGFETWKENEILGSLADKQTNGQ